MLCHLESKSERLLFFYRNAANNNRLKQNNKKYSFLHFLLCVILEDAESCLNVDIFHDLVKQFWAQSNYFRTTFNGLESIKQQKSSLTFTDETTN